MSFGEKLVVSYLTKLRVEFINQVTDCKLLKIEPYRHPKFGGFRKKPYLCTVIQRYHPHWLLRMSRVNQSSLITNH